MLEAAQKNKLRTSEFCEDEITSSIFGPLQYFQGDLVYQFFRDLWDASSIYRGNRLLKARNEDAESFVAGVYRPPKLIGQVKCVFRFWPRLNNQKEPDFIVDVFDGGDLAWSFLIEVKWNAGLSKDQLEEQYKGWLEKSCHDEKKLSHLLIVLHMGMALRGIIEHPKPVAIISWIQLQRVLSKISGFNNYCFSKSVWLFLSHLGAKDFNGFPRTDILESNSLKPDFIRKLYFNEKAQEISFEGSYFNFTVNTNREN